VINFKVQMINFKVQLINSMIQGIHSNQIHSSGDIGILGRWCLE